MREKTNRAYSRSVHRRWSFDFTYYFFTENKKPLRYTVYGTRAIQDAVVSASEIIMWCDVSQVSEKCYGSFFFFFSPPIFFPPFENCAGLCSPASNVLVRPAKRALREHDITTATRWLCVACCEKFKHCSVQRVRCSLRERTLSSFRRDVSQPSNESRVFQPCFSTSGSVCDFSVWLTDTSDIRFVTRNSDHRRERLVPQRRAQLAIES